MTTIDIYNRALAALGHDVFVSDEDSVFIEAVHCRREWEGARQAVLSAHEWGWLVMEVAACNATESTDAATGDPVYSYPRPSGALRITGVLNEDGGRAKWSSVNGVIQTTAEIAKIAYIPDEEDPSEWPAYVVDAAVAELAARIAFPLKKDGGLMNAMRDLATAAMRVAMLHDSREVRYGGDRTNRYEDARR